MDKAAVAVIGTGEMGSAVAAALMRGGCPVAILTERRSAASIARVAALGLTTLATMEDLVARGGLALSIVPPAQAAAAAERFRDAFLARPHSMTYVDCNAVAPRTVRHVEAIVRAAGADFLDAGIIGGPPREGADGPLIFVSGPRPDRMTDLRAAGLDVRIAGPAVGDASALKMSYAGVTKGLTALCALMQEHATAHGLGDQLQAALKETRPDLWHFLESAVPGMVPKAYRWIAEMREIAAYTAPDDAATRIYEGAARFYERVAEDAAVKPR